MYPIKSDSLISDLVFKHKEMLLEQICSYPLWQEARLTWPSHIVSIEDLALTVGLDSGDLCKRLNQLLELKNRIKLCLDSTEWQRSKSDWVEIDIRFDADSTHENSIEKQDIPHVIAQCLQAKKAIGLIASTSEQAYSAAYFFLEKGIDMIFLFYEREKLSRKR